MTRNQTGPIGVPNGRIRECRTGTRVSSMISPPRLAKPPRMRSRALLGRRSIGVATGAAAPPTGDAAATTAAGAGGRSDPRAGRAPRLPGPARRAAGAGPGLGPHRREQDHLADVLGARQQHDQPVDADAEPAGAGQPVFQRAHVVEVDVAGLGVALGLGPRLGLEGGQLRAGIVLLAVGVAQLEAGDHQLESLDISRPGAMHPGQRRHLLRVVDARRSGSTMSCWIFSSTTCFISLPEPQSSSQRTPSPSRIARASLDRHGRIDASTPSRCLIRSDMVMRGHGGDRSMV